MKGGEGTQITGLNVSMALFLTDIQLRADWTEESGEVRLQPRRHHLAQAHPAVPPHKISCGYILDNQMP